MDHQIENLCFICVHLWLKIIHNKSPASDAVI